MITHEPHEPVPPSNPLDAWTEAEKTAFQILCEATGHTEGTSAFIGEKSDVLNSFCFYNDVTQYGGEVFYARRPSTFVLPYSAVGTFGSRAGIQRWAMAVMNALPVCGVGNVAHFRLASDGIGSIKLEPQGLFAGENEPRPCYTLTLSFDLVILVR